MIGGFDLKRKDTGYAVLIILFLLVTPVLLTPWIHGNDGLGYYMIMRSVWIDGNFDFSDEINQFQERWPTLLYLKSPLTGMYVTHYGIGNALLWTPWFTTAHALTKGANFFGANLAEDGFSYLYVLLVSFSSAFYAFIGLLLIYHLMRQYFSKVASLTATLLTWFASPLLYYMYFSPTVSHATSFFAITLFIWYWHKTRKKRTSGQWALLGLMGALTFLVRQEDAMIMILPAIESLMSHIKSWKKHKMDVALLKHNILFLAAFSAGAFLQFLFFKHIYGTWFVTGDQLAVHSFAWANALHFPKILFAADHSLFRWVPVSIAGIVGWYYLYKKDRLLAQSAVAVFVLFVLFTATVKQWMAIASFSARHFTGIFGIFALGIAALYDHLNKKIPSPYLICAAGLFILYNLNLVVQYGAGILAIQDPIIFSNLAHNTVVDLPRRLIDIINNFLFKRGSFISP